MLFNYSFLLPDTLAGCAMPGAEEPLKVELTRAHHDGIRGLVTLTEMPLDKSIVQEVGLTYLHLPITDFMPPTLRQMNDFVEFVDRVKDDGGATLVHCRAGIGRTGTMLAAYLVAKGTTTKAAIKEVRRARPGSIETRAQEQVLKDFEASL